MGRPIKVLRSIRLLRGQKHFFGFSHNFKSFFSLVWFLIKVTVKLGLHITLIKKQTMYSF